MRRVNWPFRCRSQMRGAGAGSCVPGVCLLGCPCDVDGCADRDGCGRFGRRLSKWACAASVHLLKGQSTGDRLFEFVCSRGNRGHLEGYKKMFSKAISKSNRLTKRWPPLSTSLLASLCQVSVLVGKRLSSSLFWSQSIRECDSSMNIEAFRDLCIHSLTWEWHGAHKDQLTPIVFGCAGVYTCFKRVASFHLADRY